MTVTDQTPSDRHEQQEHQKHHHASADEVSIGDLLSSLWRQRVAIALSLAAGLGLAALVLGLLLAVVPSAETTSLSFRLRFAGAAEGTYPNGMPFQPADIVAPSVVRPVYDALGLDRFIKYKDLKAALTVIESSEALDLLRREYAAKLSNAKLTQAERAALEEEYASRQAAARTSEFKLQFLSGENGVVPLDVAQALLPAVLESWASEAQYVRGAWMYDVAVPGQGLLNAADLQQEDYLVVVDMLRLTLKRVDEALVKLSEIPGANLVRAAGDNGLSIVEARARLDDLVRFKIEPLFAQVYGQGIFRDRGATTRYLEHRLFKLGLDARALQQKSETIENVLAQLSNASSGQPSVQQGDVAASASQRAVVIPQFGDSFMDRLMEVGAQTADVDFRRELSEKVVELRNEMIDIELEQNLYQALLKGFSAVSDVVDLAELTQAGEQPEKKELQTKVAIEKRFTEVIADSRFLIDQLQGIHQVISDQTLQPHNIYSVTRPAERNRTNSIGLRVIVGVFVVFFLLGVVIAAAVAWQRETARKSLA